MNNLDQQRLERMGVADPHQERRDYDISGASPLVGLLDNPWYPPYVSDRSHFHNCMEIGMCLSGHGRIYMGRQEWHFSEGTFVVVPAGLRHSQQNEGERLTHWRYILVNEEKLLREMPQRNRLQIQKLLDSTRRQGIYQPKDDASAGLLRVFQAMFDLNQRSRASVDMELEALLYLMMAQIARLPEQLLSNIAVDEESCALIEPALQYVSENYMQEIRMSQMAAACAMSESYFRKVFARIMGMPPLEYVNRYRINRSINLLRATDETVLNIASRTGFPSIATYNRNFQKYVGTSPAEWRKNAHR